MAIPDPKYQNSAGRLLAILKAIPQNNQSIVEFYSTLFDTPASNQDERTRNCINSVREVGNLYQEFLREMQDPKISEDFRSEVSSGLISLGQTIYPMQFNGGFRMPSDAEKSVLGIAASLLPQEVGLPQDDITTIRASIVSLRDLVEKGNLSSELQRVLLDLIRMSEDAISHYNIRGAKGLRKAFKSMLAEAWELRRFESAGGNSEEFEKSSTWETIKKHLKAFDVVSSKVLKWVPAIDLGYHLYIGQ